MFTLRFDMRASAGAAPAVDLYAGAVEMCSWAETRGAVVAVLSEHHGTEDAHLPVPQILASAGGSKAAARRAGRLGLGFISQTDSPELKEFYQTECRARGHEPGMMQFPAPGAPTTVFVADSLAALREDGGPYRIFTVGEAVAYIRAGRPLPLHPLCGGVPPDIAWPYLERAVAAAARASNE